MRLLVAILVAIIIFRLQHSLYRKNWANRLTASVKFERPECMVGENNTLIETINNAKNLPLPVLHAKFSVDRSLAFDNRENASVTDSYHRNDVFCILGNQKITRQLSFRAQKRGYFEIPSVELVAKDLFLTGFFAESIRNRTHLYVYPEAIKGSEIDTLSMTLLGEIQVRKNLLEDPFIFNGIREYSYGDTMNRVNWKASARTGDLMVNQFHHSSDLYIKILLNLEPNTMNRPEELLEVSIRLASELSGRYLRDNVPVMFASNGIDKVSKQVSTVEKGSSFEHHTTINQSLARIEKSAGNDVFMSYLDQAISSGEKNISYVVISSYCREELLEKLDYLNSHDVPVRMIVPYYDIVGLDQTRDYIYGWQVKYNES